MFCWHLDFDRVTSNIYYFAIKDNEFSMDIISLKMWNGIHRIWMVVWYNFTIMIALWMCGESYLSEWQRFNKRGYGKKYKDIPFFYRAFQYSKFSSWQIRSRKTYAKLYIPFKGSWKLLILLIILFENT